MDSFWKINYVLNVTTLCALPVKILTKPVFNPVIPTVKNVILLNFVYLATTDFI